MQKRCVLIYNGCRLHAEVAIHVVEIESGDAMFAHGAFKGGAAIHRFGCVISHIFDYNPPVRLDQQQRENFVICNT